MSDIVGLLNEALQTEYGELFLYPREASLIQDKEIAQTFEKFGRMEVRHADTLAMEIFKLGGKPKLDIKLLESGSNLSEMLKMHLENEQKMVQLYKRCIDAVEDEQLKLVLMGIKADEEYHEKTIADFIKKIK